MRRRIWVILGSLIAALVFTGIIVIGANQKYSEAKRTAQVWGANGIIPAGKVITQQDIRLMEVPDSFKGNLVTDQNELIGKTLSMGALSGNPIFKNQISLLNGVDKGKIRVVVNTEKSASGLAMAGDTVDVYVSDKTKPGTLIAPNVKVLASYDQSGNILAPEYAGNKEILGSTISIKSRVPYLVELIVPESMKDVVPAIVTFDKAGQIVLVKRQGEN